MISTLLWIVLFFITAIILTFLLFFADSGERANVQALLIGGVVAVVVSMLLLLRFLDNPVQAGFGALEPVATERALAPIDEELTIIGGNIPIPCEETGAAV